MKKLTTIVTLILALLITTGVLVFASESFGSYQEAVQAYSDRGYKRLTKLKNPVIVEAEDFVAEGMEREPRTGLIPKVEIVTTDETNVSGGKYVTKWADRYHYLEYKVTVPQTGLYSITFKYRIPRAQRDVGFFIRGITIDGVQPFSQAGRLTLPKGDTMPGSQTLVGDPYFNWVEKKIVGALEQYVEEPYLFYLEKDREYTVRLTSNGGGIDFDYFAFTEAHRSTPKALVGLKRMWDLLLASFKMD
ncbi:MAG: hypothetical protein PHC96_09885 [Firmicutes bacterium]|nr:hypothetical protein [Bacillota bacterium]